MKLKRTERETPEINTTALPDIIMMLLFFFMVTTVMQDSLLSDIDIPFNESKESVDKIKDGVIRIALFSQGSDDMISINDELSEVSNMDVLAEDQINEMKLSNNYPEKAILYIESGTKMSLVNSLKSELQEYNILKLEYIHKSS